jgi:hypothetical protein
MSDALRAGHSYHPTGGKADSSGKEKFQAESTVKHWYIASLLYTSIHLQSERVDRVKNDL